MLYHALDQLSPRQQNCQCPQRQDKGKPDFMHLSDTEEVLSYDGPLCCAIRLFNNAI